MDPGSARLRRLSRMTRACPSQHGRLYAAARRSGEMSFGSAPLRGVARTTLARFPCMNAMTTLTEDAFSCAAQGLCLSPNSRALPAGDSAKGPCHATHRHPPRHRHLGRRAGEPSLLCRDAGHAPGQEDGESGRHLGLSPVLCRRRRLCRLGPDLLRLAGCACAPRHAFDQPHLVARRRRGLAGMVARPPDRGRRHGHPDPRDQRPSRRRFRGSGGPAPDADRRWRRDPLRGLGEEPGSGGASDSRPRPGHHLGAASSSAPKSC